MNSIDVVAQLLQNGFITQKEIKAITGLSQATISRSLKSLGDSLLLLPQSSPKQFTLPLDYKNTKPFGLAEVDEHGKELYIGNVYALAGGKYFVQPLQGASSLYLGHKKDGFFNE